MADSFDDEPQFFQLLLSLQGAAWMMLGKVANPLTGKVERDLDGARTNIDMLVMLKNRTQGNRTDREDQFISHIIQELQANYVEEAAKGDAPAEESKEDGGDASEGKQDEGEDKPENAS